MPQGPASLKRPQEELKPSASAPTPIQETCAALSPRKPAGFQETEDYAQFKACILHKTGINLNLYKRPQMYRRFQHMVERANVGNFMEYYDVLKRDDDEFAAFLDRMTINVSALFRNPEKWQELRDSVLTPMLANRRALKVWSAGCSNGAEPYTLAILLDQLAPGGRHTIHATDLDPKILAKAKKARLPAPMSNTWTQRREIATCCACPSGRGRMRRYSPSIRSNRKSGRASAFALTTCWRMHSTPITISSAAATS